MYTVMVAAMHRRVIAVDPILTNLGLIRRSLEVAENTKFVSFVNNPIRFYSSSTLENFLWKYL